MATIAIFGTLGKNPVIDGDSKASFSVCENQYEGAGKDKKPIWYNCQWWGKRGVAMAKNWQKGQQAFITGELTFFTTNDGKELPCINVTEGNTAFSKDREGAGKPDTVEATKEHPLSNPAPFDDDVPF